MTETKINILKKRIVDLEIALSYEKLRRYQMRAEIFGKRWQHVMDLLRRYDHKLSECEELFAPKGYTLKEDLEKLIVLMIELERWKEIFDYECRDTDKT